jgi:mediator of RNA polymerase II transcription subunit 17
MTQALRKAGLTATFVLYTPQMEVGTPPPGPNQPAASQLLVRNLLQPIDFHLKVTLPHDTILTIRGRTFAIPATTTTYHVLLPETSLLHKLCPPYKDGYPDVGALAEYLHTATIRLLTEHALSVLTTSTSSSSSAWNRSIKGTSLRLVSDDANGDLELHLLMDGTSSDGSTSTPALVLEKARSGELGTSDEQRWRWQAEGSSEAQSLETVLRGVCNEITTTTD